MTRNILFSLLLSLVATSLFAFEAQEQTVIPEIVLGAEQTTYGHIKSMRVNGFFRSNPNYNGLKFEILSYGDKDILVSYWEGAKEESFVIHGVLVKDFEYRGIMVFKTVHFTFRPIKPEYTELRTKINETIALGIDAYWSA
jgi:hypothetical protein